METQKTPVNISDEEFLAEALQVVDEAKQRGVLLRILGGFAVYIHCERDESRLLQKTLGRLGEGKPTFTDLDLGGYSAQWKSIKYVLEDVLHLYPDRLINALYGHSRLVYSHPTHHYPVDVFLDKLEFSHTVTFGSLDKNPRLALDYPTLNLTDLMLEKLQIHQINKKDLIDIFVLLLDHDVLEVPGHRQSLDGSYIADLLSQDWGFWYDATGNLNLTLEFGTSLANQGMISSEAWQMVVSRIKKLRQLIDAKEKSKNWKAREKVGTKKPWYREVSDIM
jgi:hypothetical protein